MPAERPWLLGLSDLVLGAPNHARGLGYDWTEAIQASIDLTKEVAPVVVASVKAGKKKKGGGGGKQAPAAPVPSAQPAPSTGVPAWAIPAALGLTAVVGAVLLTRRPPPAAAPVPARNPRRSRHVR